MKYYEIQAVKGDNKLVERFFDDGRRFIKYIPFNPKVVVALKEQFKNHPMDVELNDKGWIVLTKTGYDEKMAQAAKKVVGDVEMTVEKLAENEMNMLQKAGYRVKLNMGEIDGT